MRPWDLQVAKISAWCNENGYRLHVRLDGKCYLTKAGPQVIQNGARQ